MLLNTPKNMKVSLSTYYLKSDALMWWRTILETRPAYETFSEFLVAFRREYFTKTMVLEKKLKFDYLE
ncbi:hypothetical protein Scep_004560 [Stephania cephalantha]|uniref:Retrotransposon gag domain-containing protein n=1 Tax=Stephania cephalantha TaxID=152367 RepID=A0AAP0KSP5_9MAGN